MPASARPRVLALSMTAMALVALCTAARSEAWPSAPSAGGSRGSTTAVPQPKISWDPIPYGDERKRQMANYSHRHYGERTWRLDDPQAIVLHYTATSTYPPVFNTFAANAPALGERPGVCSQFVVDKDGTIHQLTRLYVRCRHTVGLNHVALGVEMVQEDLGTRHGSDQAILDRDLQVRAATHLVAWLEQRYEIPTDDVIGHAMANGSHLFEDLEGWRNDHVDWRAGDVREFRERVAKIIRSHGRGRPQPGQAGSPQSGEGVKRRVVFGRSLEGRRLVARRLGGSGAPGTALIVGEIHGDEEAGRSVVRRLRAHPAALGDAAVWTIGSVNPDGHEMDARTNADGVDLNRNFAADWDGSEPAGSGYYAGPGPFSEPESRALRDLVRRIDPDVTVYYHQPWGSVLLPCSGPAPLQKGYARIARLPTDRCRGAHLHGTATRWQNRRGGTAFVVEFGPGRIGDSEIRRNARAVAAIVPR